MRKTLLLLSLLMCSFLFSQDLKSIYNEHDHFVNLKNTDLSYGTLFVEKIKKINGNHNYFLSEKFIKSDITYRNQKYYDINLKYDLIEDNLIVAIPDPKKNYTIILEKKMIDSFKVNNFSFIRTKEYGFLEEFFIDKKYTIYKKHSKKTDQRKLERNFFHYTFKKKEQYVFYYNNTYILVESQKDLIHYFPDKSNEIKSFYKREKELRKKKPDEFFIKLSKLIKENI